MRKRQYEEIKANHTQVYVISVYDGLLEERMAIAAELWENDIKAEYMFKAKPRLQAQFDVCNKDLIPFSVIIGKDELEKGIVKIKDMRNKNTEEARGVEVPRARMIQELKQRLAL
ncbi:Cytoplasmic and mitochondrial histidine tRNA synthetase [Dimargaris xerosporica]|nr:Cytoplasmic and mitochondrial histidine tRNA synthetase [Dimargaris xerosporica]